MENASQALLIAAGVLIALIIVSFIIIGYNQISEYYRNKDEIALSEQLIDFNKQYITYNRDNVRGTELISLVNKINDFNKINPEQEKIEIDILIPEDNEATYKTFYYKYDEHRSSEELLKFDYVYNQDNIENKLLSEAKKIENKYPAGVPTKLANNISTLLGDNETRREQLLRDLKISGSIDEIDILKYYQYQQFKRAHFNCANLEYNGQGRVKKFTFVFNKKFE